MSSGARFLKFWFPVIVYSGIIFYASSRPSAALPVGWPALDKIVHILEYVPFGILTARASTHSWPHWNKKGIFIFVFCVTCVYALSDEWHQSFVPGRDPSIYDGLADIVGAVLGVFIYRYFKNLRNNQHV